MEPCAPSIRAQNPAGAVIAFALDEKHLHFVMLNSDDILYNCVYAFGLSWSIFSFVLIIKNRRIDIKI